LRAFGNFIDSWNRDAAKVVSEIRDEISKSRVECANTVYDSAADQQLSPLHQLTLTSLHKQLQVDRKKAKNRKRRRLLHLRTAKFITIGKVNKHFNGKSLKRLKIFFRPAGTPYQRLRKKIKTLLFFKRVSSTTVKKRFSKKKKKLLKKLPSIFKKKRRLRRKHKKYLRFFSSLKSKATKKKGSRFSVLCSALNATKRRKKQVYSLYNLFENTGIEKSARSLFSIIASSKKRYPPFPLKRPPRFLPKPEYLFFKYRQ
jgi:hypothetical protein